MPDKFYQRLPQKKIGQSEIESKLKEVSPSFYDAAWELCRRGIIRPGVTAYGEQSTEAGVAGDGYSITPFGRQWLIESSTNEYVVPTEPERFAKMLQPHIKKFGQGFHQRAQQAIRCYGAHAYLACCAMCGAAAESIFLAIAIAKFKDEAWVLKNYRKANGRSTIVNKIIGQPNKKITQEFKGFISLLNYWRDESAHGQVSDIHENEAYTALAFLLRFAMFVDKCWEELVA